MLSTFVQWILEVAFIRRRKTKQFVSKCKHEPTHERPNGLARLYSPDAPPEHSVHRQCTTGSLLAIGFQCRVSMQTGALNPPAKYSDHIIEPTHNHIISSRKGHKLTLLARERYHQLPLHVIQIGWVSATCQLPHFTNLCLRTHDGF